MTARVSGKFLDYHHMWLYNEVRSLGERKIIPDPGLISVLKDLLQDSTWESIHMVQKIILSVCTPEWLAREVRRLHMANEYLHLINIMEIFQIIQSEQAVSIRKMLEGAKADKEVAVKAIDFYHQELLTNIQNGRKA